MEYAPKDIVGPVQVGDRKIIALLLNLSLQSCRCRLALETIRPSCAEKTLLIVGVDDNTRRIGGMLVALEIQVRGK